jgi:uncharacterized protein (UPF0332 family)
MTLTKEDRKALIAIRLQRAKETMGEAKGNIQMAYWRIAVNRLYYACYYATTALLIQHNHTAHTHTGVISQFGLHFIAAGIIDKEEGKILKQLFNLRQSGDYDDWFEISEKDVLPLLAPAEAFIATIESLINNDKD